MPLEQHYSPATLAELLDCSTETLRRAAIAGELRSVRVGSDRRYPESAVNEWLRRGGDVQIERGQLLQLDRRRAGGA
jgi:excisionase family DNA binding protein